jgi:hypothetical protein
MKPREWGRNLLLGIDQLANAVLRGDPDETISSSEPWLFDRANAWMLLHRMTGADRWRTLAELMQP